MPMARLGGGGGAVVVEVRHVDDLSADFAALDERIEIAKSLAREIGQAPAPAALPYQGVWKPGQTYSPGQFVTRGGSMWHCRNATEEPPGSGGENWELAVKRGKDGKDACP